MAARLSDDLRSEIVRRFYGGSSFRGIANAVGVDRKTVKAVVEAHQRQRSEPHSALAPPVRRASILDPFERQIEDLLGRFPDITAVRLHEELRARDFGGGYTIVRDRMRVLRARPATEPVVRFETAPGVQAQMDYSPYDIDFAAEGRLRVHAFSYILGYSRRRYLSFVDHYDFTTTIREHVRAFEHLGGVASICLYDSMKVVVLFWDGEQPVYNPRFLAFCFHYGYRPWACRRRRPQTKGKVEEPFRFVSSNLLNARNFSTRADLNAFTQSVWLPKVDARPHDTTKRPPLELWEQERPQLLPLPQHPYDTAEVFYRHVGPEWHIPYRQNFYSVPWTRIGQHLPVRATEAELIVYGPDINEVARHALVEPGRNERRTLPEHAPGSDEPRRYELLQERFAELGEHGVVFLEGLVRNRRYGKEEAHRVLSLTDTYERQDLIAAIERACRYRAYRLTAIERILSAQAQPRKPLAALVTDAAQHISPALLEEPVPPRSGAEYLRLHEDADHDEQEEP
jgi:transposase